MLSAHAHLHAAHAAYAGLGGLALEQKAFLLGICFLIGSAVFHAARRALTGGKKRPAAPASRRRRLPRGSY